MKSLCNKRRMCHHSTVILLDGGLGLIIFLLWVFCLIDVIVHDAALCKHLPKPVWVLIVLFLFDIGAVLWLVVGRTWQSAGQSGGPNASAYRQRYGGANRRAAPNYPEYDRPGRFAATNPEDDEAFLAQVRERAEAQRRAYQERRRAELQREQDELRRRRRDDDQPDTSEPV